MLLADKDIREYLEKGKIVIDPLPDLDVALSACGVDLRLGYEFSTFESMHIPYFDPLNPPSDKKIQMKKTRLKKGEFFILHPRQFALAATYEWIEMPDDIAGRLEGRSSFGRLGIVVHSTASLIHPGMKGNIVLELSNHSSVPVALYPEMRICLISFEKLTQPAQRPYYKQKNAKYLNQKSVVESRIAKED